MLYTLGNVYISDTYNSAVRKVTAATGIITTFLGSATLSYPGSAICVDSSGIYYTNAGTFFE